MTDDFTQGTPAEEIMTGTSDPAAEPPVVEAAARRSVPGAPKAAGHEESPSFLRWLLETIVMIALAFVLAQGIKTFLVQPFVIPTGSMEPTILIGDRVLAEKISLRLGEPEVGDVVVFNDPTGRHEQLIKRVIAVAGQEIDIREGSVFIDGARLDEPYLSGVETEAGSEPMPQTIPDGYVWLMGDNRPNSGDSRFLGAQPVSAIKGRAVATYWPLGRIGKL
ncbi:MAG: signal peptidase I [Coriobacteriia bacterium]